MVPSRPSWRMLEGKLLLQSIKHFMILSRDYKEGGIFKLVYELVDSWIVHNHYWRQYTGMSSFRG